MKKLLILTLLLILLSACQNQQSRDYLLSETQEEISQRMAWWEEARFGMFIHWGLYAIPAGEYNGEKINGIGEWIMQQAPIPIKEYEKYAPQFDPVKFNANEWVSIAKNAGMKYIVITSKHHDGFALWDSKASDWDIIDATPFERDVLKELAEACKKEGIKLCFYHSIMDWHHPDAQAMWEPDYNHGRDSDKINPNFPRYIENYLKPQLTELLTEYGDIGVLWFDGEWVPDYTSDMGKDIYNFVRNLQPEIIINNRVDKGRQGMHGMNMEGDFAGDFGTPEQEIPDTGLKDVKWESCMTMNQTWGFKSDDHNWKSKESLIRNLVDIASKGGNFLLNVGPTAKGLIPQASVERLLSIGDWLKINGEAIYGTKSSPFNKPHWGRYTQKGNTLFAHVFDWPQDLKLTIPAEKKIIKAYLLSDAGKKPLSITTSDSGSIILLPEEAPDKIASVVVLE